MELTESIVCVVDDDNAVCELTTRILNSGNFAAKSYASAADFLADLDEDLIDCVVTDLRMPSIDGMELQKRLNELDSVISVIVLTGHADVRTAVRLMEGGAVTLLEKPYRPDELLAAVTKAVGQTRMRREYRSELKRIGERVARLNQEEFEVLECMVNGLSNKAIAAKLVLSMRTLDRRRQSVLAKMEVSSASELATCITKWNRRPR